MSFSKVSCLPFGSALHSAIFACHAGTCVPVVATCISLVLLRSTTPETGQHFWAFDKMNVYIAQFRVRVELEHEHHGLAGGGDESPNASRRHHCSNSTTTSRATVHASTRCYVYTEGRSCPQGSEDYGESGGGASCFDRLGNFD